jgi:predicted nucleic acid-binding protein
VATAEQIYVDPSALCRLYLHQNGSREMVGFRCRIEGAFPVTHHGRVEVVNAIALAAFRKEITKEKAMEAWDLLDSEFATGGLRQTDILWRAALNRAADLSREHCATIGARALDVLHVSCALELGLQKFVTFDARQKKLAVAAGLKVLSIGT